MGVSSEVNVDANLIFSGRRIGAERVHLLYADELAV